jgi:hypothetical protein
MVLKIPRLSSYSIYSDSQLSASRFNVARKVSLRVPTRLVPNTSAGSPAKVPANPLATSWLPDRSGRRDRNAAYVGWCAAHPSRCRRRSVGAGRPEIGTAAEKPAIAQDQHAAVAALHAVEHMHVDRIKPILHGLRISPGAWGVEPVGLRGASRGLHQYNRRLSARPTVS